MSDQSPAQPEPDPVDQVEDVAAAQRMRDDLAKIDGRRERVLADYERALADGDPTARLVLEVAAKIDTERQALAERLADTEAVASEWDTADGGGLVQSVDLLRALQDGSTTEAMRAAMARAVTGIYAGLKDGRLRAEFALRAPRGVPYLLRHAQPASLTAERVTLSETGAQTLVYIQPARARTWPPPL
jgi:hypothetical protein